ncbi:hypothetical protein R1flu_000105 [Riccia fluitans]|uniref:MACPF domain-containing protein n=1 Tax=Riccia fluitans TaxID=41844 RepID=A0ABD1XZI3_9MARC
MNPSAGFMIRPPSMLQTASAVLLVLFSLNAATGSLPKAAVRSLGRCVYLPDVTLESDHLSEPMIFDADDLGELAKTESDNFASVNSNWFEESKTLKASIATEMGISGGYRGVELSVSSAFNKVTGHETDVKVADVHAVSYSSRTFVERGSNLYKFPLKSDFLKDFQGFPVTVKDPHTDSAWGPFRDFMNKWGSHIVTAAYTGVVFQSWSSAKAE